jgi:hypothetical protein
MAKPEFVHSQQLVFFVDLLGSKAVVSDSDHQRVKSLTEMLHDISRTKRNFDITKFEALRKKIAFAMPAISTFSDNVLISFKIDEMSSEMDSPIKEAFWVAQTLIGRLALDALQIGMLIRGGATLNSLYHHDGVAIGHGLIEAYDLERTVAHYPRIAVSRKVYSKGSFEEIVTDEDGVKHFDYMSELLRLISEPVRLQAAIEQAKKNVEYFEEHEKWNQMSKWVWMFRKLEDERRQRALP